VSDQQWADKLAIQELIYRYSDAVTRGDLEAMRSVFASDAIWESPLFGLRYESARAFCDHFAESTTTVDLLIQTAQNPVVQLVDDDTARATTTIFELTRGTLALDGAFGAQGDSINFADYGVYYDDVAKRNGQWLFTHRLFVPFYVEQGAARGELPTNRSSLLGAT
jgi:ketosteroid isomerase-like protein